MATNPFPITITGIKETEFALKQLPERIVNKIARRAIRSGANVFKDSMKNNAEKSRDTGDLIRSITIKVKTYAANHVVYAAIGPEFRQRPHAHLVEFGHRIVTGGTTKRIGVKTGRTPGARKRSRTGRGAVAGFVPPNPFARPAEDANKHAVLALVQSQLIRETELELNRLLKTVK